MAGSGLVDLGEKKNFVFCCTQETNDPNSVSLSSFLLPAAPQQAYGAAAAQGGGAGAAQKGGFLNTLCCCCGGDSTKHNANGGAAQPAVQQQQQQSMMAAAGASGGLLGPQPADLAGRKCLVLDLDETLVHSSFKPVSSQCHAMLASVVLL